MADATLGTAPKDIFDISSPSEDAPGKYALLLTRGMSSPFGGARHAVFYVDGLRGQSYGTDSVAVFEGWLAARTPGNSDRHVVVAFPSGCLFVLVERSQLSSRTVIETEVAEWELKKSVETAMGALIQPPAVDGKQLDPTTGQYL
jgi:hypothetical protein